MISVTLHCVYERNFSDHVFSDGLPARDVSILFHHAPEVRPVKMTDVVHYKHGTWFVLLLVPKRAYPNTKKSLYVWECVSVCMYMIVFV